ASVNHSWRGRAAGDCIADYVLRVLIFYRLLGLWFSYGFAIDVADYVTSTLSGIARLLSDRQVDRSPSSAGAALHVIFSRASDRGYNDQLRGCVLDLLHRCHPLRRHSDSFACPGNALHVLAFVSAPVRIRIRCVGGLHATGVFADLVTCVAYAASFDNCVESAARIAFASCRVKRGCERWEKSGRTVRARAKNGYANHNGTDVHCWD